MARPKFTGNLTAALAELRRLVGEGMEYPDAEWLAAYRCRVDPAELRAEYDRGAP